MFTATVKRLKKIIRNTTEFTLVGVMLMSQFAFTFASLIQAPSALADAADPIPATTIGSTVVNGDGTVTLTVNGQWQWPTRNDDCNVSRFGVGWAVDWNDATQLGNNVAQVNGSGPVIDVGVLTGNALNPTDNAVHYAGSAPFCGVFVFDAGNGYNSGNWGPLSHTYPAGTTSLEPCVVTYDLHNEKDQGQPTGNPKPGDLIAGGASRNTDNSVEENGSTPLGNGCFTYDFAQLTVVKNVTNDGGGTNVASDFTMNVTATNVQPSASFAGSETGTTVTLDPGAYSVDEDAFVGYTKSVGSSCSGTVAAGEHKICTITNDDSDVVLPTITLIKEVTNDNGGTAGVNDFGLTVGGDSVSSGDTTTVAIGEDIALDEAGLTGYAFVDITGDDCPTDLGGTVNLVAGEDITCTITNDDISPTLTLVKTVNNNNGGGLTQDDFQAYIDGGAVDWDVAYEVNAGGSLATEDVPKGYEASVWSGSCADNGEITLELDTDYTCYVTNTDTPATLTLTKRVVNDDGGRARAVDFIPAINGRNTTWGFKHVVSAGDYTASETELPGYQASEWGGDCDPDGSITLAVGQSASCYIVNDDIAPTLTVIKHVMNDDGGTEVATSFRIDVTGSDVSETPFRGQEAPGKTVTLNAGRYSVAETTHPGYAVSYSGDCRGIIAIGQHKTCTITNDDISGTITVTKRVSNDSGGLAGISDFMLFVDNTRVRSGATNDFAVGNYEVSEVALATGYEQAFIRCFIGDTQIRNPFDLGLDEHVRCIVGNDDLPADITVFKRVINDDGGEATIQDFELYVNRNQVRHGASNAVDANEWYTISERPQVRGYEHVSTTCWDNTTQRPLTNPFIADNGHQITCTIVNDDIAPTITIHKRVINDNGGDAEGDDWSFKLRYGRRASTWLDNGETFEGRSNRDYRFNEFGPDGYEFVRIRGEGCPRELGQTFTLQPGQDLECWVVNDDIPPKVIIVKSTRPRNHEQDFDFRIRNNQDVERFTLDTDRGDSEYKKFAVFGDLDAGRMAVQEREAEGWELSSIRCFNIREILRDTSDFTLESFGLGDPFVTETENNFVRFRIGIGETVLCKFLNRGIGDINVVKFHDLNEDGYWDEETEPTLEGWEIELLKKRHRRGPVHIDWQTTNEEGVASFEDLYTNKTYIIEEEVQEGWRQTNIYCGSQDNGLETLLLHRYTRPSNHVNLEPGEEATCYVGNAQLPYLLIDKTNDGPETTTGETVTFTIVVTNPDESIRAFDGSRPHDTGDSGVVKDIQVTDILQDGLTYNLASWSASSTRAGHNDMTLSSIYASPGLWSLGTMFPGEVITLTYSATVGDLVDGDYPDTAFVEGFAFDGFRLFGNCGVFNILCGGGGEPEVLALRSFTVATIATGTPFVGTTVVVTSPQDTPETGFVLGQQLVNTGVPAILPSMIGAVISLIAIFMSGGKKKRNYSWITSKFAALLIGVFGASFMFMASASPAYATASNFWTFNFSEPESIVTNTDLNFDYQVSSVDGADTYTVDLLMDAAVVDTQAVATANASGTFDVLFPGEGTFIYKLMATNHDDGAPVQTSPDIAITFDTTPPAAPTYGTSTRTGDSYVVTFTAPTDTDVVTLLLFASTETVSVPLDLTTLIGTIPTTPGEAHSFDFAAPTSDQYHFAVLAVDGANNFSDPVGDELLIAVVSDVSEEDLESVLGTETDDPTVTTGDRDAEVGTSTEGDRFVSSIGIVLTLAILGYLAWLVFGTKKAASVFDDDDEDDQEDDDEDSSSSPF